jgi:hypothetical protein
MPTSSSYLCPYILIGYNSFHFWTLWVDNPVVKQGVVYSLSIEVDGEDAYQVSSVEDSGVYCNRLQYTIL